MIVDAWYTENYLKKLADAQTQSKELVPDSLKENGERRMREYIIKCSDEFVKQMKDQGMTDEFELIRCKDCELFYKNMSPFGKHECDSGNENGYCFWAVRKEECQLGK